MCAKLAHGLADDMLTTTVLACPCPKLIAPAMNTKMYENPVTQDNWICYAAMGGEVIAPASGRPFCGAVARQDAGPDTLVQHILRVLALPTTWRAGGSWSPVPPRVLDPVRYLLNHSPENGLRHRQDGHAPGRRSP